MISEFHIKWLLESNTKENTHIEPDLTKSENSEPQVILENNFIKLKEEN